LLDEVYPVSKSAKETPLLRESSFFKIPKPDKPFIKTLKTFLFISCGFLSLWILFLEILEFCSESSLIIILDHLWGKNQQSIIPEILSSILLIISSIYTIGAVFFFMIHFNLGHFTGIRLNHRSSLSSLVSLSRWFGVFTFPVCYFLFQIVLTPKEYQNTYFYNSLKTTDYLFFFGKPFPWLITPVLVLFVLIFWMKWHLSIANKLGYYFFGVDKVKFAELKENEKDFLMKSYTDMEDSDIRGKFKTNIFTFVKKSAWDHIRNLKTMSWQKWPESFNESSYYLGLPVQDRIHFLSFENYLYKYYDVFLMDYNFYQNIERQNMERGDFLIRR
jgi:hypothetical protein